MGTNRLLREKWDFSHLATEPSDCGCRRREELPAASPRSRSSVLIGLVCAAMLGLIAFWMPSRLSLVSASALFGFEALQKLITSNEIIYWITQVSVIILAGVLFGWIVQKDSEKESKQTNIDPILNAVGWVFRVVGIVVALLPLTLIPVAAKYFSDWLNILVAIGLIEVTFLSILWAGKVRPAFVDWIIGISAVYLITYGLLQAYPGWLPDKLQKADGTLAWLRNALEALVNVVNAAPEILVSLAAVAVAVKIVESDCSDKVKLSDEEKNERGRSRFRARSHKNLSRIEPKLLLLGSKPLKDTTVIKHCKLMEIRLSDTRDTYRFDRHELLDLVDAHMAVDESSEVEVLIVLDASQEVWTFGTLTEFLDKLENNNAFAAAFEWPGTASRKVIRDELHSDAEFFEAGMTKVGAIRKMAQLRVDRLLMINRKKRYVGFCNLGNLVHEIYV